MSVVVRLIAWSNGAPLKCAGEYIGFVDVQMAGKSNNWLVPVKSLVMARKWDSPSDFFKVWKEVLESDPVRPDGEPNRPLTALTVEIVNLDVASKEAGEVWSDDEEGGDGET